MPQKIAFITKPKAEFEVPSSEGYQLYSAILEIIRESDEAISEHAHNSPIGSIALGGLRGRFKRCGRPHHKLLDPHNKYEFCVGITDPKEVEIFQSLIKPLILRERDIVLDQGALGIEEVASFGATFEELVESAKGFQDPKIEFWFRSATCIQYKNTKVFEMFPHREAVFFSLVAKWNAVCPTPKMDIERDEIARYVLERPDAQSYRTHSAMVNTVFDKRKGHPRPILRQGFSGRCTYSFAKGAPQDFRNAILVLSRFAEYSGVGSAVSRGCGWVEVGVSEVRK
ncbi:MAG TPA: CRISPR system precrRNA processing endoribonuclease RAMP protein Cas6 [Methanotrichaceae archaeon]|nr:CRISPR system precrRNA processing endoribonuclease RAMP protein Cas6 [Methanotrichaceae archaeon]